MSSNPERLRQLFQHYLYDTGTPAEISEFLQLFAELEDDDPVRKDLWQLWEASGQPRDQRDWDGLLQRIHEVADDWERADSPASRPKRRWWRLAAAAAAMLFLAGGAYLLFSERPAPTLAGTCANCLDRSPGGNRAVLTLAGGQKIILDSAETGQLANQGNSRVIKVNNGLLTYHARTGNGHDQQPVQYNTLSTPRGGIFQLVLPDGTKVWLNDGSSIRFPTSFTGKERRVWVTGESYFEVAPDPNAPFYVDNKAVEIQVLGTHFDINAYQDETAVKVTLLQGSVKVMERNTRHSRFVRPGEQVEVEKGGRIRMAANVNLDQVIAWKNNLFWFEDDDIQSVMREISRWYDVDVVIKGDIPLHFTGSIPRNIMLSGVFEVLKRTGSIHFKIEANKKVIVSP